MNEAVSKLPLSYVLVYVLSGIALLFLFRIVRAYIIPIDSPNRDSILRTLNKLKIIVWLVFVALFIYRSFIENAYLTLAFLAIIFTVGLHFWRNLFSGIIIHLSTQFKLGDSISTDHVSGEIRSIGYTQSEIMNEKGELVVLPNFHLKSGVLKHLNKKENAKIYSFTITSEHPRTRIDIKKLALNCPFISANQKIEVDTEDGRIFNVKASILDPSLMDKIELYFEQT